MPTRPEIAEEFRRFGRDHPEQEALARAFIALLDDAGPVFARERREGHFTASAFVVSADGQRALMLHHRKLGRWLQPGGHADGDADLARVSLREAEEETGLSGLVIESGVFDLDRHTIPARGAEPEHLHWDVRYVLRCTGDETPRINGESKAFAWRGIDELARDETLDPSIRRMAARWLTEGRK